MRPNGNFKENLMGAADSILQFALYKFGHIEKVTKLFKKHDGQLLRDVDFGELDLHILIF